MISLNLDRVEPPFEQIRVQLADQIASGTVLAGTRLPTVRRLAADLNVAAGTVARAYRELEQLGLVETRGRAGTFASPHVDTEQAIQEAMANLIARARGAGLPPHRLRALLETAIRADDSEPAYFPSSAFRPHASR